VSAFWDGIKNKKIEELIRADESVAAACFASFLKLRLCTFCYEKRDILLRIPIHMPLQFVALRDR